MEGNALVLALVAVGPMVMTITAVNSTICGKMCSNFHSISLEKLNFRKASLVQGRGGMLAMFAEFRSGTNDMT